MMLRLGTSADVDIVYTMCRNFYHQADLTFELDEQHGKQFLHTHITGPESLTLIWEKASQPAGCLIAIAPLHPFFPVRIANELVWWMEPNSRGSGSLKMFQAFEYWAKEIKKCQAISVTSTSSTDPTLEKYYQRKGYSLRESTWTKELN